MAAGMSTRFVPMSIEVPKGLIVVKGEVLIERLIKQLQEANIQDIIVVTGYQAQQYDYLAEKFNVKLIYNPEYETRNNHSSLYYAQEHLKNSYICSSDNYYTENVFSEFEESAYYSTIYSEGQTDEWVVTKDQEGYINSVEIGGENADFMIGHAFFDEQFSNAFKQILNEKYHSVEIINMLWESLYKEHLDVLKLKIKRHEPYQILEFDNLKELRKFDPWYKTKSNSPILLNISKQLDTPIKRVKKIRPVMSGNKLVGFKFRVKKHKYQYLIEQDLLFDASRLISGEHISSIKEVIQQELENNQKVKIHGIYKLGGLTNDNYLVHYNQKKIVFRLPGKGSNQLINRYDEGLNMEAAKKVGIDADVLFYDPELGIKITKYIEDSQTLSNEDFKKPKVFKQVAKLLKNLHDSNQKVKVNFDVKSKIEYYETLILKEIEIPFEGYHQTKEIVQSLMERIDHQMTFCHNDALAENFLLHEKGLTLIDWEYAGMNHPFWDVAGVIVEVKFNKKNEQKFIETYFDRKPTEEELVQIQIQKVLIDFLWSLWGLYFSLTGKDYMDYAVGRYENCLRNLEELV